MPENRLQRTRDAYIEENQYKCAWCGGIFDLVRDENWSDEKANEEYDKLFPGASMKNRDVVCDDCWQFLKPTSPIKGF